MDHEHEARATRVAVTLTPDEHRALVHEAAHRSMQQGRPIAVSTIAVEALRRGLEVRDAGRAA